MLCFKSTYYIYCSLSCAKGLAFWVQLVAASPFLSSTLILYPLEWHSAAQFALLFALSSYDLLLQRICRLLRHELTLQFLGCLCPEGLGTSFHCGTFPSPAVALLRSSCCLPGLHAGSGVPWDPLCGPRLHPSLVVVLLASAVHSALLCTICLGGCTEILWSAGRRQCCEHCFGILPFSLFLWFAEAVHVCSEPLATLCPSLAKAEPFHGRRFHSKLLLPLPFLCTPCFSAGRS